MNPAYRSLLTVGFVFLAAVFIHACASDEHDDDDDDCGSAIPNPLTDCESVCNENTCAVALECEDYIEIGAPDDCLSSCMQGCEAGCIPEGAGACLENFTDCESLIQCLTPLFTL